MASNEEEESRKVHEGAVQLEAAVKALLFSPDAEQRQLANAWLSSFCQEPRAWSVALYFVFPPPGVAAASDDARFFALNIVLSKLRADWSELSVADAGEIFEAVLRQLPGVAAGGLLRSRLCLVIAAAAAVTGADTCYELVEVMTRDASYDVALEVLTALADETVHRASALPWEVTECMQDCSGMVLRLLKRHLVPPSGAELAPEMISRSFTKQTGVTLSELHRDAPQVLKALLAALGTRHAASQEAAAGVLAELVAEVDVLPGRSEAVRATIQGLLAARAVPGVDQGPLVAVVTAVGTSEAGLLARAGEDSLQVLQWLLALTGGAGAPPGQEDEGVSWAHAAMACEAWPRLAAIPKQRRAAELQGPELFTAVLQALFTSAAHPADGAEVDDDLEDDFARLREGAAMDALRACYRELGPAFIAALSEKLRGAATWQAAEVALFAAIAAGPEILQTTAGVTPGPMSPAGGVDTDRQLADAQGASQFLLGLLTGLPGAAAVVAKDVARAPHASLVATALQLVETCALFCARHLAALEAAMSYVIGALYVPSARGRAAAALQALCQGAAPHIAAARVLAPLMQSCEEAAAAVASAGCPLALSERTAIAQGLASVPTQAAGVALAADLAVVAAVVAVVGDSSSPLPDLPTSHAPAAASQASAEEILVPLLQGAWPALDQVAARWADNAPVVASLCAVWGATAEAVGAQLAPVLPQVIEAAVRMFQLHLQAACLDCLAAIVAMPRVGARAAPSCEGPLAAIPGQLLAALPLLERLSGGVQAQAQLQLPASPGQKGQPRSTSLTMAAGAGSPHRTANRGSQRREEEACEALSAVWRVGGAFLRHSPDLLLPSQAFPDLCRCATACMRRLEVEVAQSAVTFVAEVISGRQLDDGDGEEERWEVPEELMQRHVDEVLAQVGSSTMQGAVHMLISGVRAPEVVEALGDVVRALCARYHSASEAAMSAALKGPSSPVRSGVLSDAQLQRFVTLATREPPLPRRTFQELIGRFAKVCNGLAPAESLEGFGN
eukprot:jgi/Mesen1/696/ME000109S_10921